MNNKYTDASLSSNERLAAYLLDKKLIRKEEIDACLMQINITQQALSDALVENGFIRHDTLIDAMMKVMPANLVHEEKIVQHIPTEMFQDYKFKISAEGYGKVYVSTLTSEETLKSKLKEYYPDQEIIFVAADPDAIDSYIALVETINSSDSSALEKLIRDGIKKGASDIHILQRAKSYSVSYRIDGVTRLDYEGEVKEFMAISSMIKDRASMDMAERRMPQDGGFDIEYNGRQIALRVASIPLINNCETIVLRILDPEKSHIKLESLGISRIEEWIKGASRASGINLVCGETGSGKTTTITSSAREINRFEKVVFTVEDPVEHRTPYFRQININPDIGLTFDKALRAIMRADPNIIIIGEIRDVETAQTAIAAAMTGHLVFATIHTGSILGAIDRFTYLGVEAYKIKSVLRSVLVQNLIRKTCTECNNEEDRIHECSTCHGIGYKGRTVISECNYFESESEIDLALRERAVSWPTMTEDALQKVLSGELDLGEVVRVFGPEGVKLIKENIEELERNGKDPKSFLPQDHKGAE